MRAELTSFSRRLAVVKAQPDDLPLVYRSTVVTTFALRNLAAVLFGFPLFLLGLALFSVPFLLSRWLPGVLRVDDDARATAKFLATLTLAPIWLALIGAAGYRLGGVPVAVAFALAAIPFALWTRYFFERRVTAFKDARVFFVLGLRRPLKRRLVSEGQKLADQVYLLAEEYRERVVEGAGRKTA